MRLAKAILPKNSCGLRDQPFKDRRSLVWPRISTSFIALPHFIPGRGTFIIISLFSGPFQPHESHIHKQTFTQTQNDAMSFAMDKNMMKRFKTIDVRLKFNSSESSKLTFCQQLQPKEDPKKQFTNVATRKIIVVGGSGVGKTSLIQRYVHNIYYKNNKTTVRFKSQRCYST